MTFSVNENDNAETLKRFLLFKICFVLSINKIKTGIFLTFSKCLAVLTCNSIYSFAYDINICHSYAFNGSASILQIKASKHNRFECDRNKDPVVFIGTQAQQ